MKRSILIVAVLLIAFSAVVYVFIPGRIPLQKKLSVETTERGITRFLLHPGQWRNWWPGDSSGRYGGYRFSPQNVTVSGLSLIVRKNGKTWNGKIVYAVTGEKEAEITWLANIKTSANPVQRVLDYIETQAMQQAVNDVLTALKVFLADDRKVYGLDLKVEKVRDTLVLTTRRSLPHLPGTQEVYGQISILRKKMAQNRLTALDSPMLNVIKTGDVYHVTTAIAVNRRIPPDEGFYMSSLVAGNVLTATVTGGSQKVRRGLENMKDYMTDHRLISPAMPFQQLVVNRQIQKDSAKWVTRLYYPIF